MHVRQTRHRRRGHSRQDDHLVHDRSDAQRSGLEPSFAIGATVSGFGTNAQAGAGQWFVAEADESDGTLVNYCPEIAIVTNVEPDHLDHYASAEEFEQVFVTFVGTSFQGRPGALRG